MTVLTVNELAARWKCNRQAISDGIRDNRISAFPVNPSAKRPTWRIPLEAVEAIEASGGMAKPDRSRRRKKMAGVIQFFK